jgi:hypothetical protein
MGLKTKNDCAGEGQQQFTGKKKNSWVGESDQ